MFNQLFRNMPVVVKNLLIINVLFFLAIFLLGDVGYQLYNETALYHFTSPMFKPWQLITSSFSHGGIFHILINMLALVSFGSYLENIWGPKKFLKFYLFSAFSSVAFIFLVNSIKLKYMTGNAFFSEGNLPEIYFEQVKGILYGKTVGASGAIFGLLTAYYKYLPNSQVMLLFPPIPIKLKNLFPFIIIGSILCLIFGFFPGISHSGHLGGAIGGFILLNTILKNRNDFF